MITILGPTACGKTLLAANLAFKTGSEIISADSRMVYKGMDIGSGKDYDDYIVENTKIPYHLIDIVEAGYEYNVYEYQKDFLYVYNKFKNNNITPILCGGTGMYLEAVLQGYKLVKVPNNDELRSCLQTKEISELIEELKSFGTIHNTTDLTNKDRLIRAIEIQDYYKNNPDIDRSFPKINSLIIGINVERSVVRERITKRLKQRLECGMIEEVESLLKKLKPEQLSFYGLEYKFLTNFLTGKLTYDEMFSNLNTAIHQFSKRQMTWFRRMEKKGCEINWIDGQKTMDEKLKEILSLIKKNSFLP